MGGLLVRIEGSSKFKVVRGLFFSWFYGVEFMGSSKIGKVLQFIFKIEKQEGERMEREYFGGFFVGDLENYFRGNRIFQKQLGFQLKQMV